MFDAIINYAGIARKVGSGVPHLSGRHNKKLFFVTLLAVKQKRFKKIALDSIPSPSSQVSTSSNYRRESSLG